MQIVFANSFTKFLTKTSESFVSQGFVLSQDTNTTKVDDEGQGIIFKKFSCKL
jgi:hypothetical protein